MSLRYVPGTIRDTKRAEVILHVMLFSMLSRISAHVGIAQCSWPPCCRSKWTIAFGCGLVAWVCLTAPGAPPLLSPLWPTTLVVCGAYFLASAAITVPEAVVETVLQSYCEDVLHSAASKEDAKSGATQAAVGPT